MWGSNCGIIGVGSKISTMQSGSLICFRIGQMPVGAEGDRISSDKASHIANLKVQPVLFHINITQGDQEPGLFCFTPGNKNTPTNWHWYNLQVMAACEPGMSEVCVCVAWVTQHHWCGHRAKVHTEMCGLGSRGVMASVNGVARVSTSALSLSSFPKLLCHLHFSAWHTQWPPPLSQVTEALMEVKKRVDSRV